MANKKIEGLAKKIAYLNDECEKGNNISENMIKIEELVKSCSLEDLLKIDELIMKNNILIKPIKLSQSFLEKCSILDEMQLAYCVIELVFDENGHGLDFIFRYCNKEMERLEGVPIENMLNHSFYEVFKNGDKKWLVAYADVALNGVKRTIRDYSPEIGKTLTIHCYQPEPGYCACVLTEDEQNE